MSGEFDYVKLDCKKNIYATHVNIDEQVKKKRMHVTAQPSQTGCFVRYK